jgi:hypothetical protein
VSLCGVNAQTYPAGVGASFAGDTSVAAATGSNSLIVGKATATVVVTPYHVTYDGNQHTATVTSITGVCGETGATVGTVDVSGTTHVSASGSPYSDTWSFAGTGNYNNIPAGPSTTITDIIDKKDATWNTNPNSKTYGDADPSPLTTGTGSGFVTGDVLVATYSRAAGETVAGGPYHITASLGPADVVANYNITNNGANFTINPAPLDITATNQSKSYGDTFTPNGATQFATGTGQLKNGDVVASVTLNSPATLQPQRFREAHMTLHRVLRCLRQ